MNDKMLTKFILSFLVHKEDYTKLDTDQQQLIFLTCKTIMMAIYNSIKYENDKGQPIELSFIHLILKGSVDDDWEGVVDEGYNNPSETEAKGYFERRPPWISDFFCLCYNGLMFLQSWILGVGFR